MPRRCNGRYLHDRKKQCFVFTVRIVHESCGDRWFRRHPSWQRPIALKQNDIKKVLAYSTVSQLGYMFLALGVGAYSTGVFHVMTHAFFKALLFLAAGSVIHAMGGEQDIRKMGGLNRLKITSITFLVGCIAIAGVPPFSGFFSKDAILLAAFEHDKILYAVALFGAMLTAYYMFRLFVLTFTGKFRGTEEQERHLHESPPAMTIVLVILAILLLSEVLLASLV
jgi:NADH-quinone oxidoreductase subunit L